MLDRPNKHSLSWTTTDFLVKPTQPSPISLALSPLGGYLASSFPTFGDGRGVSGSEPGPESADGLKFSLPLSLTSSFSSFPPLLIFEQAQTVHSTMKLPSMPWLVATSSLPFGYSRESSSGQPTATGRSTSITRSGFQMPPRSSLLFKKLLWVTMRLPLMRLRKLNSTNSDSKQDGWFFKSLRNSKKFQLLVF